MSNGPSGSSQNEESESDLQDEIQLTSSDDEEVTEDNFQIIFSKKHRDPIEADLKFDTHRFTKGKYGLKVGGPLQQWTFTLNYACPFPHTRF